VALFEVLEGYIETSQHYYRYINCGSSNTNISQCYVRPYLNRINTNRQMRLICAGRYFKCFIVTQRA